MRNSSLKSNSEFKSEFGLFNINLHAILKLALIPLVLKGPIFIIQSANKFFCKYRIKVKNAHEGERNDWYTLNCSNSSWTTSFEVTAKIAGSRAARSIIVGCILAWTTGPINENKKPIGNEKVECRNEINIDKLNKSSTLWKKHYVGSNSGPLSIQ